MYVSVMCSGEDEQCKVWNEVPKWCAVPAWHVIQAHIYAVAGRLILVQPRPPPVVHGPGCTMMGRLFDETYCRFIIMSKATQVNVIRLIVSEIPSFECIMIWWVLNGTANVRKQAWQNKGMSTLICQFHCMLMVMKLKTKDLIGSQWKHNPFLFKPPKLVWMLKMSSHKTLCIIFALFVNNFPAHALSAKCLSKGKLLTQFSFKQGSVVSCDQPLQILTSYVPRMLHFSTFF